MVTSISVAKESSKLTIMDLSLTNELLARKEAPQSRGTKTDYAGVTPASGTAAWRSTCPADRRRPCAGESPDETSVWTVIDSLGLSDAVLLCILAMGAE